MVRLFLAKGGKKTGEQELDHNEEIIVELFTIEEVKQLIKENKIIQSMHVAMLYYAFEKMAI